ncbi:MAG: LacI family DNA-binding transcriptional regulator [Chloroflexi bacterium]|nr:LacI family DNA-binding transcriptional regulator [Chloroflexota bacterium]
MTVTIKDVARRTGLSLSTVSRALNKSGYVSQDTQRRVDEAVAELGYQPNWMARSLKGKPSRLIGLIMPDVSSSYDNTIIQLVCNTLHAHNYELILCLSNEDPAIDLGYLKILQEKRVAGLIYIYPAGGSNSAFVRELASQGMPIIELNRRREEDLLDAVLADNVQGAYQITKYLIELGHRRIGLVLGETELTTGKNRLTGYRRALDDHGIAIDPLLICIGSFSRQHGERGTRQLLQLTERPTAILAGSNRILMGMLGALRQEGLRIPDDVSVATFNDTEWLSFLTPPITVVDVAIDEMAQLAVDLLLRRLVSPSKTYRPTTYLLSTSLIKRESCKNLLEGMGLSNFF